MIEKAGRSWYRMVYSLTVSVLCWCVQLPLLGPGLGLLMVTEANPCSGVSHALAMCSALTCTQEQGGRGGGVMGT